MDTTQTKKPNIGDCEVCDKTGVIITCHYGNMWFCDECWATEEALKNANPSPTIVSTPEPINPIAAKVAEISREVDNSIEVRTDLFNAATTSIIELKTSIDANAEIVNKPYALAEELTNRHKHFQNLIFELNEKIVEVSNQQRAIQVYLNQMANQLRSEEREKLRIADINYKPIAKPRVKSISTTQTKKSTKLDKVALRKAAAELGVSEFTLQQIAVAKQCTIEQAAEYLKNLKAQTAPRLVENN